MSSFSSSWRQYCFTPEDAETELRMHETLMCPAHMSSFHQYLEALQSSGQAQCTTVWTRGTVAYRCRTCQVNDASAICKGCLLKGEHRMHDYVMFHSGSGGCCDCGDPEAWQEIGFCSAHRSVDREDPSVPLELEGPTKGSVSNVLGMLSFILGYIPETKGGPPVSEKRRIETAMVFLDWLKKLCSVDALRKIVCSEVVLLTVKDKETRELKAPLQILLKTFAGMPEEIMEGETTLFLQMLYSPDFKQKYSAELMENYQAMIESVVDRNIRDSSNDPLVKHFKALDSSLERVMVQIFNVANMELIKGKNLLKLFVMSFGKIIKHCVRSDTNVVNVRDPRIVYKMYLRPQGDLRLIVAHEPVAQLLLEEQPDVFMSILDVLVLLQWMNPYYSTKYVDFEVQNEWTLAIQLEMNTMAIVFQIISRCFLIYKPEMEDPTETSRKTLLTTAFCTLKRLHKYLKEESMLIFLNDTSSNTPMSLHIPLHRTLSAILAKLVLLPWKDAKDGFLSSLNFGYSEKEVLALMEHPLRIMVWMAQIRAKRWEHASEDFSRLELIYRGSFWHDQSMDMDILLLQFCAVARENMERAVFMRMAELFELKELVSSPQFEHERLVGDKISLLQDFIRLVLLVVRERRNTGMKEEDCLRYDVIQWLCVRNQTYSQLCRALSAIPVNHEKLTEMLDIVAHFHHPKVQERGYYELKAECWQEFDPLFAHFYSNELVDAQERAVHVGKLPHYWRIKPSGVVKPPYNRLINLLHTEECHQLLWNVLNYVSALAMNDSTATACESLGVIALQMMGLALQDRRGNAEKLPASSAAWQSPHVWSNDILHNVHRRPQFNQNTGVMEWGIYQSQYPSIIDLVRKLHVVTNAPRLVDSALYVMHLLTNVPRPGASLTDTELHVPVHAIEDDESQQKKQQQEAIMAQFKPKYDLSKIFNGTVQEPLSKILAFLTTEGYPFRGSWLQWLRIRAGKSDPELLSRNKGRVESKDLITGRFLGQGCSGIFYETTWSSQKAMLRLARKDFPGVKGDIFVAEAVRLFELHDHPNIVKTFCWTVDSRSCSLVMEHMKDDLSSFMRKKKEALRKEGVQAVTPFPLLEALDILSQIATGVEYLHGKGICHGDLKPNNVLVDWKEGRMVVKVADFGLAESKRNSSLISQRAVWFRMIEWSAPELLEDYLSSMSEDLDFSWTGLDPSSSDASCCENGQKCLLEKADSYSFGLTSAYVLGSKMWNTELSPNELRKQISSLSSRPELPWECPKALTTLIWSCWNADPTHRPTFSDIRDEMQEIVEEQRELQDEYGSRRPSAGVGSPDTSTAGGSRDASAAGGSERRSSSAVDYAARWVQEVFRRAQTLQDIVNVYSSSAFVPVDSQGSNRDSDSFVTTQLRAFML